MKTLSILFALILFTACNKENLRNRNVERVDFFANTKDALLKVQRYADGFGKKEIVDKILNVSYIDSEHKSYAFVFYRSNLGPGSMVIVQEYNGNIVLNSKSVKCDGESCTCKVKSIIGDDGQIYLDCNCATCSMIIH
jgi:hypothetical protein